MCDEAHEHGALAGIELDARRRARRARASRAGRRSARRSSRATTTPSSSPRRWSRRTSARVRGDWVRAAQPSRARRLRHRLRLRRPQLPADCSSCRPSTTSAPTSTAARWRTARASGSRRSRRCARRSATTARSPCASASRRSAPAGVELEEALEFVRLADHLVDLWDVNVGSILEWSKDSGPSRFFEEGYQLEWTGRVREATAKPIVGVGRLTNPDRMAEIVRSGAWDLIGAARPSIADPFLPRKIEEGRYGEIRECIGCNVCIAKAEHGDAHRLHPERDRRRGVPPRLAPGAVRARGQRRPRRARRRRRPGGHGVRDRARQARLPPRAPRRRGGRRSAAVMRWVPQLPGLGEWGARRQLATGPARRSWRTSRSSPAYGFDAAGVRDVRRRARRRRHRRALGRRRPQRRHPRADPRRRRVRSRTSSRPSRSWSRASGRPGERVVVYDCEGYFIGAGLAERSRPTAARRARRRRSTRVAPFCDETLEGTAAAPAPPRARRRAAAGDVLTGIEAGRVTATERVRRAVRARRRRGRARHAAALRRQPVPRARRPTGTRWPPRASRPSTGSATASRRGSSPTPSSTGTASRARSTRETRPSRCRTCASGPARPGRGSRSGCASAPSSPAASARSRTPGSTSPTGRASQRGSGSRRTRRTTRAGDRRVPALPESGRHRERDSQRHPLLAGSATRPCVWTCGARGRKRRRSSQRVPAPGAGRRA